MYERPLAAAPLQTAAWFAEQQRQLVFDLAGRVASHLLGVITEQVLGVLEQEHARAVPTEVLEAYVAVARHRGAG